MAKPGIGIAYCVNDSRPYKQMLETSIRSLNRFNEGWPIEVIQLSAGADLLGSVRWHLGSRVEGVVRRFIGDKNGHEARRNAIAEKIRLFSDPPFEKTLFVDCDTIILRPLSTLFEQIHAGVDVAIQQWIPGEIYAPVPPFTTERFRRLNSGVVYFTPGFSAEYRRCVSECSVDIATLHDQDQYIFSRVVELLAPERKQELPTLQITNRPAELDALGCADHSTAVNKIVLDRSGYYFYHYIHKKKQSMASVKRRIGV